MRVPLAWLRDYNTGRPDKVQFVGVEYYLTGQVAYDAVEVGTEKPARCHACGGLGWV